VLLTTGSRNLGPYAAQAAATGRPLIVRVLDHPDSLAACHRAGIPREHILAGRGPYSVERNQQDIRRFAIGVLVTKDSGLLGGTLEKLEAARREHCRIVALRRPALDEATCFADSDALLDALHHGDLGVTLLDRKKRTN